MCRDRGVDASEKERRKVTQQRAMSQVGMLILAMKGKTSVGNDDLPARLLL